jgi:hypothetical protein
VDKGLRRIPGNIAESNTGKDRHVEKGWRQFFFTDPRCTVQNSTGGACIDSVVETTGNTVITFKTGHSGGTLFPMDGYVAGLPLRTDEGDIITFGTPFVLKVMIELISISGDYDNGGEAKTQGMITMGICMNTDFDADDNRHYGFGCRLMCEGSEAIEEDIKWTIDHLESDGSGQDDTSGNAYSGSNNPKLFVGEFMVGPDMATASGNAVLMHQEFKASGDNYAVTNSNISFSSLGANQGFNNAATPVTLYAAVQDREQDSFSGNTACVITARFWYMVEADYHNLWGGSGSA